VVRKEVPWAGYWIHLSIQLKNKTWQQGGGGGWSGGQISAVSRDG